MSNIKKINVTLAGHVDHGKSTLIEAITGKFPDSHKFEIEKNMTVFLKVISFRYDKKTVINFLDTPGHSDFRAAVNVALAASDAVILVVSAVKGFQARSEYIIRQALKQKKQIIIAATKMDLPTADVERIKSWLQKKGITNLSVVPVSAKEGVGISELLEVITTQLKIRRRYKAPPEIFILGVKTLKGIGDAYLVLIKKGTLLRGMKLAGKFDVRNIYSLSLKKVNKATAGEYVYIVLTNKERVIFDTGTVLTIDRTFKIDDIDEGVYTTRTYKIRIHKPQQFHEAERILHALANDTLGMSVMRSNDLLEVSVVGNLQFELAKEKLLERNIEFAVEEERENEIITIANRVKIRTKKAEIELIPRSRKGVVVERYGGSLQDFDAIGVVTAAEALKVQGLYAIVKKGTTADDIAEAVAKGIEKAGLIKIVQNKSILIKSNYPNKIAEVATEFGGTITSISKDSILVLIPVSSLDDFINKALHSTKGFVEINLIKIEHNERILAIDPGMRHIGFAYIEGDEIPELWTINLDWPLDIPRLGDMMIKKIKNELQLFLKDKSPPTKVFIGSGIGSEFIVKTCFSLFDIKKTDIFLVDETKSTKEAVFRLRSERLEKVNAQTLVDHGIAALLIARRGLSGSRIKIRNAIEKTQAYISSTYGVGDIFKRLATIKSLKDLRPGVYLRIKDPSYFKTNVRKGDIFTFWKLGKDKSLVVTSLSGQRMILKWKNEVSPEKVFNNALSPGKSKEK